MRGSLLWLLAVAAIAAADPWRPYPVKPLPPPKLPPLAEVPIGDRSPAGQVRLAAQDLATRVRPEDRPYTFYLSLYDDESAEAALDAVLLDFGVNTVSQGPAVKKLVPVPGSGGILRRGDRRWYRWTRAALSAVARRDPIFRDKSIPVRESQFIRETLGIPQDPNTLAVEGVLSGTFLLRAILQPDGHGSTYYDLLYAEQRFGPDDTERVVAVVPDDPGPEPAKPTPVRWPGGRYSDGKDYPEGAFQYWPRPVWEKYQASLALWKEKKLRREAGAAGGSRLVPPGPLLKDFPATGEDFRVFWGGRAVLDESDKRGRIEARGEVVAGARNSVKGSYVALNDRAYLVLGIGTGRYLLETTDADFTVNEFDYLENPLGVTRRKLQKRAGELLAHADNGCQAALLVNQDDKRVEAADGRIARNTFDPHEPNVLTQIGCLQCHLPFGGYVEPTNRKLRESLERGIKLKTYTASQQVEIEGFFLGWEDLEKGIRLKTEGFVRRATAEGPADKGWTGAQVVGGVTAFRDRYDAVVKLDAAARMLGVPKPLAFLALSASPTAGLNLVATDQGMPRAAWDATGWKEAAALVELWRTPYALFLGGFNASVPFPWAGGLGGLDRGPPGPAGPGR